MANAHLASLFSEENRLKRTYLELLAALGDKDARNEFWNDAAEMYAVPGSTVERSAAELNDLVEALRNLVLENTPLPAGIPAYIATKMNDLKELFDQSEEDKKASLKKRMEEYQAGHTYGGQRGGKKLKSKTRKQRKQRQQKQRRYSRKQ
jgi:hypothetical protein